MTRASLLAATVAAAFLLFVPFAGATASSSSGLRATVLKGPVFPERTLVLSFPHSRALHASAVRVNENTFPVRHVRVEPATEADLQTFGVVLVLDTSCSMEGQPLEAARAAEESFFKARRNPNEAVGVINFNKSATTVLPLTTSQTELQKALAATPQVSCGTHIFDAVARAEDMLKNGHINSGSIIVLSDGADTGSKASLDKVARRALRDNTRIYTVGLDGKNYQADTLTALAEAGGGEYVHAKTAALAPLFTRLSRVLSSQFLLSYTSKFGSGQLVKVDVSVGSRGGTASTAYRSPGLPAATGDETNSSFISKIFASPITMILLGVVIAALLAVLIIGIAQPRRTALPGRIAEFVSIRELQRDHATPAPTVDGAPAVKKDWWTNLRETLEIAKITIEPEVLVAGTALATILAFVLIYVVMGSVWWALLALLVPYLVREWVLRSLKRQRSRFAEQLPEALQVIGSALRSGHSFAGSLAVVVENASEPMRTEMHRVVADEQLGMPIQRSLGVVADRMASRDVDQLALVAELQRQAGGDMAEVIDRVAETVRERFDLKRLVETLTTQGRMSRWIVTLLPVVLIGFLYFFGPEHYFEPLLESTAGKVVVIFAAAWAIMGSLVIKRIVEIEV